MKHLYLPKNKYKNKYPARKETEDTVVEGKLDLKYKIIIKTKLG